MDIQLISAKNPQWLNAENSAIVLECIFSHIPNEWLSFCARPDDVEPHGRDVFARAVDGEFGSIAAYVAPPTSVPTVVTMRQARLALLQQNLLASVEAVIAQAGTAAQIEWEYATELNRNHPLTQSVSAALNLTAQQLDDLFTLAASF